MAITKVMDVVTAQTRDGLRFIEIDKIKDINTNDNYFVMESGIVHHCKKSEIERLKKLRDEYNKEL